MSVGWQILVNGKKARLSFCKATGQHWPDGMTSYQTGSHRTSDQNGPHRTSDQNGPQPLCTVCLCYVQVVHIGLFGCRRTKELL